MKIRGRIGKTDRQTDTHTERIRKSGKTTPAPSTASTKTTTTTATTSTTTIK